MRGCAALWLSMVVACGGGDPADSPDAAIDDDAAEPSATSCAVQLSPDTLNILGTIDVIATSNGESCRLIIDGGSQVDVDCDGGSVPLAGSELEIGVHEVTLTVRDGPGGSAECSRPLRVTYPGPCVVNHDFLDDGSINRIDTFSYDAVGSNTQTDFDTNADGTVDQRQTNTFDSERRLVQQELDTDLDGSADQRIEYTLDESGRVATHELDSDLDGAPEITATYFYDAGGFLVRREERFGDETSIGVAVTFTNDENGAVLTLEVDFGNDSTIDLRHTYTNDAAGQPLSIFVDPVGGVPFQSNDQTFDYACWN